MPATLMERWKTWSARFAGLQMREKYLIAGAVAVAVLFGGYTLWVEPGQLAAGRLKKALAQQQTEMEQLQSQIMALAARNSDPDSANRSALQQLREQLAAIDGEFKGFDNRLIPPGQMSGLLQTLLGRHRGLSLVSLTTLPPQSLVEAPATRGEGAKPAAATPGVPGGNVFMHGIEIKLAGSYQDLLAYITELERGPHKLIWGGMKLVVKEHPVSELTLTLYTLSLESIWLVV